MPAAITFECEASERDIADFVKALSRYQAETQRDMRGALRSAAIDLVKSLRARTRKAPKIVPREDVRWGESDPKYITGTKGRAKGMLFRRVVVKRWFLGKQNTRVKWQPVKMAYHGRRTKGGGVSESWTEAKAIMLREARYRFGGIRKWGLAKKSWGWFMKSLFGTSVQDENPKALVKPSMVDGGIQEYHETLPDGTVDQSAPMRCDIDIVNRLDYIRKALVPGALAVAVQKATNSINHKIDEGLRSRRFGS